MHACRKREVTFILLPHGDFFVIWDFLVFIILPSIYPVSICWASAVYHDVLGAPKWIKSVFNLKWFIVCCKDRLINAITKIRIRSLYVEARVFKIKVCFFKIVKYKIHIEQCIKHMPTVGQSVKEFYFMYSLCLLLLFNIMWFICMIVAFSLLCSKLFYVCTILCLVFLLLVDIWIASSFGVLLTIILRVFLIMHLGTYAHVLL